MESLKPASERRTAESSGDVLPCPNFACLQALGNPHVRVDEVMLSICLQEGLSNARKYREPGSMIRLSATYEAVVPGAVAATSMPVEAAFMLHVEVSNINRLGVAPLSKEQCSNIFEEGHKAHNSSVSSTGIGLDTTAKAIAAAGGTATMSVDHDASDGACTVLHLRLPAESAEESRSEESILAKPATEECLAPAAEAGFQPARPLICAALDDSTMSRLLHQIMFETMLNADPQRSCALGETREEQLSFVDVALGRKSASLQEIAPALTPADIVVLDQNIDLDNDVHLLGSDVAEQLHAKSFRGLVCIMTGSSRNEIERLARLPGSTLCWKKANRYFGLPSSCKKPTPERHLRPVFRVTADKLDKYSRTFFPIACECSQRCSRCVASISSRSAVAPSSRSRARRVRV